MVKLSIQEVLQLNTELDRLLSEDQISFVTKYDLVKLLEKTQAIAKRFSDSRKEVFKKFGKELENKQSTLEGSAEGLKELEKLLDKKENFKESFNIKDFKTLKSKNPYVIIMRFIKV